MNQDPDPNPHDHTEDPRVPTTTTATTTTPARRRRKAALVIWTPKRPVNHTGLDRQDHDEIQRRLAAVRDYKIAHARPGLTDDELDLVLPVPDEARNFRQRDPSRRRRFARSAYR